MAGAAIFWFLSGGLVVAGLSSIIPSIFEVPDGAREQTELKASACARQLLNLRAELFEQLAAELERAQQPSPALDTDEADWLSHWEQRRRKLSYSCPESMSAGTAELDRIRHGLEGLLRRFRKDQEESVRDLHVLIDIHRAGNRKDNAPASTASRQ